MRPLIAKIWSRNLSIHQWFFPTLAVAAVIGIVRSVFPPSLLGLLEGVLFFLGVVAAHFIDTAEDVFLITTNAVLNKLEKIEQPQNTATPFQTLTPMESSQPVSPQYQPLSSSTTPTSRSILRQPPLFLLIPICGIFLLTSSRSSLGLGFIWGLSLLLGLDLWPAIQGKSESVRQRLLPHWPEGNTILPLFALGFWIYLGILTLTLALW